MPYATTQELVDDVTALEGRVAETLALVDLATFGPADAENLRAGLDGVRSDGRAIFTLLDATADEDLEVVEDGAVLLGIWRWRRSTRSRLLTCLGQARTIQDLAAELAAGQPRKVVVSRQGDTLQRIAARELGDWREWPRLLAANPQVGVGELPSGTSLVIPERR